MTPEKLTKTLLLLKLAADKPGLIRNVWNVAKGTTGAAAKHLEGKGHGILSTAVKYSPEIAVAGGAKAGYESDTGKRLRYKYQVWKHNRAMKKRGYQ